MSWLSKKLKKAEKWVSKTAYKAGIGSDLHKAANIFGAVNVGGAVGVVSGFLTGGAPGAIYGGISGGVTAGIQKSKGSSSSKIISNSAGIAAIAGSVGPLIYKPGTAGVITSPGPVSSYGGTTTVRSPAGGFVGNLLNPGATSAGGGFMSTIKSAVDYIGKGGLQQLAVDSVRKIFQKNDPGDDPNPDYQEGNAVPPGGSFTTWLNNILPNKSFDPTAPGNSVAGPSTANPSTYIEGTPVSVITGEGGAGGFLGTIPPALLITAGIAGVYFLAKKGFARG